jgi:hypothetical protein
MKTLIPTLIAILVIGTTQAQEASYASLTKEKATYSAVHSEPSAPYIKIKARTDRKILLTWAPIPGGVSHYVLERSFDGHTFEEQGLFFTGDWVEQSEYSYVEKLRRPIAGPLFYRLRVVGVDGTVIYTPVTIINPAVAVN